ncbi:MAG: hypothetical protein JSW58_17100, partial [Candidatus Latescibacterota bacterium]
MRHKVLLLSTLLVLVISFVSQANAESVEITYVANEGFLVSTDTQKILIDALFDEGFGRYLTPSLLTRRKLTRAKPPFDNVDL